MSDIDAYNDAHTYNHVQSLRPDYTATKKLVIQFATDHLHPGGSLVDFCCGTGNYSEEIASQVGGLEHAVLIDINAGLLDEARKRNMKVEQIDYLHMNALAYEGEQTCDVAISPFAFHHFPDGDKHAIARVMHQSLKPGGMLIVAEIYLDNHENIPYYFALANACPSDTKLCTFLYQTAISIEDEHKVSATTGHAYFEDAGFVLYEQQKIWPTRHIAGVREDHGTHVETWRRE